MLKISVPGRYVHTEESKSVSLALDTPSGSHLCLYQILSKYFKPLRTYGVQKIWLINLFKGDN